MYFDSHAHFSSPEYDPDRDLLLTRAFAAGVETVMEVGTDLASSQQAVALARAHDRIFAAVGIQPYYAGSWNSSVREELEKLAFDPRVKAIGEIGLDYHYPVNPEVQKRVFQAQLRWAREASRPVIIHQREAEADMLALLADGSLDGLPGVFHCFSGGHELAQAVMARGFYISWAGQITFRNYKKKDIVRNTPLAHTLIETDAPYLTPEPYRGKRNRPEYISYTARKLAELHQEPLKEICAVTRNNAQHLFHVP